MAALSTEENLLSDNNVMTWVIDLGKKKQN